MDYLASHAVERRWRTLLPAVAGIIGISGMAWIAHALRAGFLPIWPVSADPLVNFTTTMQVFCLPLSIVAILAVFIAKPDHFRLFFRFRLSDHAAKNQKSETFIRWVTIGILFTIGTIIYVSANVIQHGGTINQKFFTLFPLVILFSFTNAWTEEILCRFAIISALFGKVHPDIICVTSAIVFGIPHLWGTPGGVFGVMAAGFLGWFLAKSVIETKAMGWALIIHFILDVVIFGSGAMILAGKS